MPHDRVFMAYMHILMRPCCALRSCLNGFIELLSVESNFKPPRRSRLYRAEHLLFVFACGHVCLTYTNNSSQGDAVPSRYPGERRGAKPDHDIHPVKEIYQKNKIAPTARLWKGRQWNISKYALSSAYYLYYFSFNRDAVLLLLLFFFLAVDFRKMS